MLKILQAELDALRRHGERMYPNECCGVLLGRADGDVRSVERAVACTNTQTERGHDRYNIDPAECKRRIESEPCNDRCGNTYYSRVVDTALLCESFHGSVPDFDFASEPCLTVIVVPLATCTVCIGSIADGASGRRPS